MKWNSTSGTDEKFHPKLTKGMENVSESSCCEREQSMLAGCVSLLGILLEEHT